MATQSQPAQADAAPCNRWEPAGKNIAISLSQEAANDILNEAIGGLMPAPRRGVETGGILLGTAERGERLLIRIEAALPLPSGHTLGPSYVLSESEKQALAKAVGQRAAHVVGFYRSHTRDGLALSAEDLALLSAYFPEPFQVALLVKPHAMRPSLAGFFFREEGGIRSESSYLELALQRKRSAPQTADPPAEPVPEPSPPAEIGLPSFLQTAPEPPARWRRWWQQWKERARQRRAARTQPLWSSWWVQVPLAALLLTTDAVLGYMVAQRFPIHLSARAAPVDPYSLRLLVEEYGNNLHLTWDRGTPALVQARRAMLTIIDGEQNRMLELSPAQLQSGSVIYRRLTTRVKFRLEVFVRDRQSVTETWELSPAGETPAELPKTGERAPQY